MPSAFEYILLNCQFVNGFSTVLQGALYFFCHIETTYSLEEKTLIFLDDAGSPFALITEEDFFDFQNAIRTVMGDKPIKPPEPIDPNEDPRIRRIKERARERDRIKAR